MAGHAERFVAVARRFGAVALLALCGGCGTVSDPAGYSVVAQDRYDFQTCEEIVRAYDGNSAREKELSALAAKAEASPGGIVVSYGAYRSELTQTRALIAAARRAAQKKNCDLSKKK
ncbi:MAG TPA: hypothetical protein VK438_05340 [Xanthobacteraceae bacterium]|nr:hypothetical protein [Xanthobacteraceae bacterium]